MNATLTDGREKAKIPVLAWDSGSFTMSVAVAPGDLEVEADELVIAAQHEHAMRQMPGFVA